MKRVYFLCLVIALWSPFSSYAVAFQPSNAQYLSRVEAVYNRDIQPYLAQIPERDVQRLKNVQIFVDPALRVERIAFSIKSVPDRIVISDAFLHQLNSFIHRYNQLEGTFKADVISEHFFDVFDVQTDFLDTSFHGHNDKAYAARHFAKDELSLEEISYRLMDRVILDILLHELGHFITNSFYDYRSPDIVRERQEQIANTWADNFKTQFISSDIAPLDRLLPVALIVQREHWIKQNNLSKPVGFGDWLSDQVAHHCELPELDQVKKACQLIFFDS